MSSETLRARSRLLLAGAVGCASFAGVAWWWLDANQGLDLGGVMLVMMTAWLLSAGAVVLLLASVAARRRAGRA